MSMTPNEHGTKAKTELKAEIAQLRDLIGIIDPRGKRRRAVYSRLLSVPDDEMTESEACLMDALSSMGEPLPSEGADGSSTRRKTWM